MMKLFFWTAKCKDQVKNEKERQKKCILSAEGQISSSDVEEFDPKQLSEMVAWSLATESVMQMEAKSANKLDVAVWKICIA